MESKESTNLVGSVIANINNIILIFLFLARIYKYPKVEYWLGVVFMLSTVPLTYMLIKAVESKRAILYFVQLSLMIGFIVVEFLLDYLLKLDFRQNQNYVIPFLIMFYSSLGGMIGIASHSGKQWAVITVITFLLMTTVSLIMHFKTNT
ncbi:MAG: hypothetical protein MUF28_03475 [Ignavibacterium sp.]|nr:hypothetical protein [Ignavibacterium sp.]